MSIKIGDHIFDGPLTDTRELMNDPGVFAVIVAKQDRGSLIDVGESSDVRRGVESHESRSRWSEVATVGTLCYAVMYTPELGPAERSEIEQSIRAQYEKNTPRKSNYDM